MRVIGKRCVSFASSWPSWRRAPALTVVRGEVFVVQADEFLELSTTLVAPTSTSALAASFRPSIELAGHETRVLVEQTTVVDPRRLGRSAGRLDSAELGPVDEALSLIVGS